MFPDLFRPAESGPAWPGGCVNRGGREAGGGATRPGSLRDNPYGGSTRALARFADPGPRGSYRDPFGIIDLLVARGAGERSGVCLSRFL